MNLRRDSYPAFHCWRCHKEFIMPRRFSSGCPCCPRCFDRDPFFGSLESFLRLRAENCRVSLPVEVGAMVGRALRRNN